MPVMTVNKQADITCILQNVKKGSKQAYDNLFPLVYNQLRDIANMRMQQEHQGHTYCRTELVHEAYFKLVNVEQVNWQDRSHFYAIASRCMRQILIDHARKKRAQKRGGTKQPVTYIDHLMYIDQQAERLINLDKALTKLEKHSERMAQIVECRYFGEMSLEDTALALNISPSTVKRDWAKARGWLYHEIKKSN